MIESTENVVEGGITAIIIGVIVIIIGILSVMDHKRRSDSSLR